MNVFSVDDRCEPRWGWNLAGRCVSRNLDGATGFRRMIFRAVETTGSIDVRLLLRAASIGTVHWSRRPRRQRQLIGHTDKNAVETLNMRRVGYLNTVRRSTHQEGSAKETYCVTPNCCFEHIAEPDLENVLLSHRGGGVLAAGGRVPSRSPARGAASLCAGGVRPAPRSSSAGPALPPLRSVSGRTRSRAEAFGLPPWSRRSRPSTCLPRLTGVTGALTTSRAIASSIRRPLARST